MAVLIARKAAVGGGGGFSFNMTAGDFAGSLQGYSDGNIINAFGSIDAEPVPGHDLSLLSSGTSVAIFFAGNAEAQLTGLTVWVGGVEFPFDGTDWGFDGDFTSGSWDTAGPTFVNTTSYFIEIK